jgi:NNP family nitrate/nitrite transporter-like MFS transporter
VRKPTYNTPSSSKAQFIANALVGGWGNMGGGMTFVIMVALYNKLTETMTPHVAWRAAFAIVPVPILIFVAILTFLFGTDHPAGKWEDRHNILAAKIQEQEGGLEEAIDHSLHPEHRMYHAPAEKKSEDSSLKGKKEKEANDDVDVIVTVEAAPPIESALDIAVNEPLTLKMAIKVLTSPLTWLPGLAYATTFGYELALDANLANILHGIYVDIGQTKAGYVSGTSSYTNDPSYYIHLAYRHIRSPQSLHATGGWHHW